MKDCKRIAGPLILLLLILCCTNAKAQAERPWESAPFSANATDIASAVRRIPDSKEPGVVILLRDIRVVVDASNRIAETHHLVYRIGTQSPGNWAAVAAVWQPWRQQRPAIRARVITLDSREVWLEPGALSESPLNSLGVETFGDGRLLRGPLPALAAGSVVEIETKVKDTIPLFSAGLAAAMSFGDFVPILHTTLTLEAPATMPLQFKVQELPGATTTNEVSAGKRVITIDHGYLVALDPEKLLPMSGENRHPRVLFSTAASWKEVANSYAQIVDRVIDQSNVGALAKDTVGNATTRDQKLERILQKVQRSIRYSAVQLGVAAVIPTSPSDTLKLEYGDCKDQAALIIAMLRASGIDAYMALLQAGPAPDVESDLPGFGAFDHAIVYVPGSDPVWIDSTTRFSRAGQLPEEDQGRLALIVKSDTTELIRTPELISRIAERQEVLLADQGRGRIVATRQFYGSDEIGLRAVNNEVDSADMQKALEQFAESAYSAKSLRGLERSDPENFSAPYQMRCEMVDSGFAVTRAGEAAAFVSLESTFDQIGVGSFTEIDDKFAADGVDMRQRIAREWNYQFVPPPGYIISEIPRTKTVRMGPATFTQEFTASSDGTVYGTILYDSGKRKYSSSEFADFKKAIAKITNDADEMLTVSFELKAQKDFDSGNVVEGLREYRKLIAARPDKAIHHSQFARSLLAHGMGELARAEARRAVELEPDSAAAHDTLGTVLEYNLVGERFKSGFELEQTQVEFRRAAELDPDDDDIRGNLAIALEYNVKGLRYAEGIDLRPAIEQYRKFHKKPDAGSAYYRNLPFDLMRIGDFEGIREINAPADFRIAAIAATDGINAAIREAGKLASDNRSRIITDAATWLLMNRRYPEAAALAKSVKTATGSPLDSITTGQYERLKKYEEFPMPENDPDTVAKRVLISLLISEKRNALPGLLSAIGQDELRRHPDLAPEGIPLAIGPIRNMAATPQATIADVLMSNLEVKLEGGDKPGFQVRFAPAQSNRSIRFYVVKEAGQYKVLTAGRNDIALAREALRQIESGDEDSARQWLDWIGDEQENHQGAIDIIVASAFDTVWETGLRKDRDRMRYAAAVVLAGSSDHAETAIPILQEGIGKTSGEVRDALATAYSTALLTLRRYEESVAAGRKALQSDPKSNAVRVVALNLVRLNRLEELKKLLTGNSKMLEEIAAVDVSLGDYADAEKQLKGAQAPAGSEIDDKLLWLAQYHSAVTENDISHAEKNVQNSRGTNAESLRTLAALKAETGKPEEALNLMKGVFSLAAEELKPDDWYIFGRIYEQYGERDSAVAAYRKVPVPRGETLNVKSAYLLSQKRLTGLAK